MDIVVISLMWVGMLLAPLYALLGMRAGDDSRASQYYRVSAVGAVLTFVTFAYQHFVTSPY